MKSTTIDLVEELKKLPQTKDIKYMIEEAIAGEYHDFKNEKYDCGKVESSKRLRKLGHINLAARIEDGEFDEKPDDEDKQRLKIAALSMGLSEDKIIEIFGLL